MIQIKNFTIKKAFIPEGGLPENMPDRKLSANIGTQENPIWVEIGAGWAKQDSKGNAYISASFNQTNKVFNKKDGSIGETHSWTLVKTSELEELLKGKTQLSQPTYPNKPKGWTNVDQHIEDHGTFMSDEDYARMNQNHAETMSRLDQKYNKPPVTTGEATPEEMDSFVKTMQQTNDEIPF